MKSRRCRVPEGRYLEHRTSATVRFQEVDSLGIVWHGHYLSYFEDARTAFGRRYGLDYTDIVRAAVTAPVVHVSCDYMSPARYGEQLEVVARLLEQDSAKLEFHYEISRGADATLLAVGCSVQAFADLQGRLILVLPEFVRRFYKSWEHLMVETHG